MAWRTSSSRKTPDSSNIGSPSKMHRFPMHIGLLSESQYRNWESSAASASTPCSAGGTGSAIAARAGRSPGEGGGGPAAVDYEVRPVDVARLVGGEEGDRVGDLVRLRRPRDGGERGRRGRVVEDVDHRCDHRRV